MPEITLANGRKFYRYSSEDEHRELVFRLVPFIHNGETKTQHTEKVYFKDPKGKDMPIVRHFYAYLDNGELKILIGGRSLLTFLESSLSKGINPFDLSGDHALHLTFDMDNTFGRIPKWELRWNVSPTNVIYKPSPEDLLSDHHGKMAYYRNLLSDPDHNPQKFGEEWAYKQRGIKVAHNVGIL